METDGQNGIKKWEDATIRGKRMGNETRGIRKRGKHQEKAGRKEKDMLRERKRKGKMET